MQITSSGAIQRKSAHKIQEPGTTDKVTTDANGLPPGLATAVAAVTQKGA